MMWSNLAHYSRTICRQHQNIERVLNIRRAGKDFTGSLTEDATAVVVLPPKPPPRPSPPAPSPTSASSPPHPPPNTEKEKKKKASLAPRLI